MLISTGIAELDSLLTRMEGKGILIPELGPESRGTSSVTVIKGAAGTGKSVLAAILSRNLNNLRVGQGENKRKLASLYFTFSQPCEGILHYLDTVLDVDPVAVTPIVISERYNPDRDPHWNDLGQIREIIDRFFAGTDILTRHNLVENLNLYVDSTTVFRICGECLTGYLNAGAPSDLVQPLIIIDPINRFFGDEHSRTSVAKTIGLFRYYGIPVILIVESDELSSGMDARLAGYVEYEADLVIQLSAEQTEYYARFIEIGKSRNAQEGFGKHLYRIESPAGHALQNVPSPWRSRHPGYMIFPSIHKCLSEWRDAAAITFCHTGMSHFDNILQEGTDALEPVLESNAFLVVTGPGDSHKLSLSFNLLVGGLSSENNQVDHEANSGKLPRAGALMVSLGEDETIHIPRIALATAELQDGPAPQNPYLNNGNIIHGFEELDVPEANVAPDRQKVILKYWQPQTSGLALDPLLVATLRPGYLGVEEFLWIVKSLVTELRPRRVLLSNTAHLHSRFPALYKERMLFPALSSMCRTRNTVFIVNDVTGEGSDKELSYALRQGADYVVRLSPCESRESNHTQRILEGWKANLPQQAGVRFSVMEVGNRRGKNYYVATHYIGVLPNRATSRNELSIMDMHNPELPTFEHH